MSKQEFDFPSVNEALLIGGWTRTSRTWKKYGEKKLWKTAWRPNKSTVHMYKPLEKWLILFLTANKRKNKHGVV